MRICIHSHSKHGHKCFEIEQEENTCIEAISSTLIVTSRNDSRQSFITTSSTNNLTYVYRLHM